MPNNSKKKRSAAAARKPAQSLHAPVTRQPDHPVFAQPEPTEDPHHFRIHHASDGKAYKAIDALRKEGKIQPLSFPAPRGGREPKLSLQEVLGDIGGSGRKVRDTARATVAKIADGGQIVFHALGDCGSTRGPKTQNLVADKLIADFKESDEREVPQFNFLLGDIVYSFGEPQYYYDQFYEPYRDYPAPILAAAGNHDGMVSPLVGAKSLEAYLRNFCAETITVTPEAGGLSRTAQIQPGVYFTFEAPFVRIITLYSNTLEDPGVIADDIIGHSQLDFIRAALERVKSERYQGALLIADHHPPYVHGHHGWSVVMREQIDTICQDVGIWPHAFLSGHAHNYQRFTRTRCEDGSQIPYVVCGNGGHNLRRLAKSRGHTLRAPQVLQRVSASDDLLVFENYDDQDYGYLRVIANASHLRIEYHPAGDGIHTKAPDDFVTVDLATRRIVYYPANDLGHPRARTAIGEEVAAMEQAKKQKSK